MERLAGSPTGVRDKKMDLAGRARDISLPDNRQRVSIRAFAIVILLMSNVCFVSQFLTSPSGTPIPQPAYPLLLSLALGVTMTLVRVPAGEFLMGSADSDRDALNDEKPQHKVYLGEYLIGKYDVTNAQYAIFAKATNRRWVIPAGKEDQPVVDVSWDDAVAFCQWASQVTGRKIRLPSEAQWEKAARGTDGRLFPWGNDEPNAYRLNYDMNIKDTTPVGKYSPAGDSPYGAADIAGNVLQWTSSLYKSYPYNGNDGREDQNIRDARVLRGGGPFDVRWAVRSAGRNKNNPDFHFVFVGFRIAVSPVQPLRHTLML
jgi:eukaryotic-like serine/threonine-protein kinase